VFLRWLLLTKIGLGDVNQTREAVSGKYFRMADHVFIVHKGRVETEIGVRRLLQESIRLHGVANTTLVINGIDVCCFAI
jgi:hypothetical protein